MNWKTVLNRRLPLFTNQWRGLIMLKTNQQYKKRIMQYNKFYPEKILTPYNKQLSVSLSNIILFLRRIYFQITNNFRQIAYAYYARFGIRIDSLIRFRNIYKYWYLPTIIYIMTTIFLLVCCGMFVIAAVSLSEQGNN